MTQVKKSPEITFRQAKLSDVDLVFSWSNDDLVRSQSFNSAKIVYENHVEWFGTKIASPSNLFLVALVNNIPAGLVRFENINLKTVIGILVNKNFRGKGLASLILEGAVSNYFSTFRTPIYAFIKKTNLASVKVFEKAGFTFLEEETVNGYQSFVYILNQQSEN